MFPRFVHSVLRFTSPAAALLFAFTSTVCRAANATDLAAARLFPAPGATEVPPDTPLRLTFDVTPTLGASGTIQIVATATNTIVETIDVGLPSAAKDIGGLPHFNYYPVIIANQAVTIHPHAPLDYDTSYHVTITPGAWVTENEACLGITDSATWHFHTKAAPPTAGTSRLIVAADGTGDFCTVQAALDFIPDGNTTPATVFVRAGIYEELIFLTNKHAVTLLGEDRQGTVITYANNANFNPSGGNPYAVGSDPSGARVRRGDSIYRRGVLLAHRVEGLTIANLTIRNTTPRGGSQAEAIILNGTIEARAIITRVDLYSFQDTLQINGQACVSDSYIEGDVDFMWGTGPCYFENCVCRSTRSDAYYTQIRNPGTNHGYIYLNCTFEGTPGVTGNFLSRIEPARFPHSEVVLLDCVLGESVGAIAWRIDKKRDGTEGDPSNLHFWEFHSTTSDGQPVDISQRLAASRQLVLPADAATIANYRNPAFVLGHDWDPRSAPIFATLAASQTPP